MKLKTKSTCPDCNSDINKIDGRYICTNCGKEYYISIDNEGNETLEFLKTIEKEEQDNFHSKKIKVKFLCIFIICILALLILFNTFSGNNIEKILNKSGYITDDSAVEHVLDLPAGIRGLEEGKDNKLILINNNGYYGYAVVNTKNESVTIPVYGYIPLNVVQQQIWGFDKEKNIKCIEIFKEHIQRYGVHCMETKSHAEGYLRKLTDNGIISVDVAQNIVNESMTRIFPSIKNNDDVVVIFENNNAVPAYYTTKSTQMVFNWGGILQNEDVYKVWKASTDHQTQQIMISLYGPPYVQKTVWAVVDSNLKEVGTYDSLEAVKKAFQK